MAYFVTAVPNISIWQLFIFISFLPEPYIPTLVEVALDVVFLILINLK